MDIRKKFREELRNVPFSGYAEYMDYVFACVNVRLADYIQGLMGKYDAGQGNYKNILYPDIEIAYDLCNDRIRQFVDPVPEETDPEAFDEEKQPEPELDPELAELLSAFSTPDDHLDAEIHTPEKLLDMGSSGISPCLPWPVPFFLPPRPATRRYSRSSMRTET